MRSRRGRGGGRYHGFCVPNTGTESGWGTSRNAHSTTVGLGRGWERRGLRKRQVQGIPVGGFPERLEQAGSLGAQGSRLEEVVPKNHSEF